MELHIIKTEAEYERASAELERLMALPDAEDEGETGDRIELLGILLEKYEEERFAMAFKALTPRELLRELMDERDLSQRDLEPYFGSQARVSDFLAGKRGLSLATIRALHDNLRIPLELLIEKDIERKPRGLAARSRRRASVRTSAAYRRSGLRSPRHKK